MLDFIHSIDVVVLDFIQAYLAPEFLYPIFDFFAEKESLFFVVIPAIPICLFFNWKKTLFFTLIIGLVILFGDQTSYHLKRETERLRPSQAHQAPETWTKFNSFPSSHAVNITGAAVVVWYFWPYFRYPMAFIALMVVYGRLFLNKHYPTDVIVGVLIGFIYSLIFIRIARWFVRKYQKQDWVKGSYRLVDES